MITVCLLVLAAVTGTLPAPTACSDDLYALEIPGTSQITLEVTMADPSADFDLSLMESDEKGRRIVAATRSHSMTTLLRRGKYYVGVSAVEGSSSYALTLSAPDLKGTASVEIVEKTVTPCDGEVKATVT